ncbi:putative F-box protein At3g23950 [Chenopodium quinoa]|uniref:F-box domain-containing protein n=1 Tax=Chenopodium quinoa TaxID=63459 RepID=A0A803L2B3_CHEQI|nr:putative F-box protein At3g23950 [Chenopodium quinoa]
MQINDLPDSLLIEILTRLPCQFAVRSKTVCKRWLSLISDPFFIRSFVHHQSLNHSSPFTLVHQFYYWHHHFAETASRKLHVVSEHPILKSQELFLDFLPCFQHPNQWPIRILASHGDLMVCHDNKLFSHQSKYYVCNLLTKQWRALPPIPGRHVEDDMAIGLVTYGDILPIFNYKVVRILKLGSHSSHLIAEIFSSDTGEWSESLLSCPQSIRRIWQFRTSAVTLNNALHWIINGNDGETIIVLDPFSGINGQCRLIDPPFELKFEMAHVCLGTCREKLRMSTIKGVHPNRMLKVWELKDYDKGEWLLQYRICLKEMVFVSDYQFNMLEFSTNLVLSFHPKDEDVVYLRCHNHIVKCNMRKGTLDVVSKCLGDPTFVIRTLTVFPLVHSCWPSSVHSQVKQ